MIRITGGALRGRRLRVPEGVRPTTELARKAAFDILGPAIEGALVLDAAAGTGAYGIEALSRGARSATFVESDAKTRAALKSNLQALGLTERTSIAPEPAGRFAVREAGLSRRFDVVFHDPPYASDAASDLRALLALVAPGGVLFHERGDELEVLPERGADDRRRYGKTRLLIFHGAEPGLTGGPALT